MNATELKKQLVTNLRASSRHDEHRNYLGMSGIGRCPRELYYRTIKPTKADDRLLWYGFTGYLREAAVKNLLGAHRDAVLTFLGGNIPVGRELVADFDDRYRGHTDHEIDNTLIEIKSTRFDKFIVNQRAGGALLEHVAQVQAYMRHGNYENAIIVYIARDAPRHEWQMPFHCVDVPRSAKLMNQLDDKARMVLAAIDRGYPPDCTCSWCRR